MSPRKEFEVLMYESEYRQIQAWVDKYQDLETGGDLFGLWADDHTAVVQLVLGPGKGCRRSSVSFYQDVEYLDRVGNLLTHDEGLCHIGEWHSHHRLGLSRPSGGDENTVWTNMNRYCIHRFFLFIATIDYDVNIGCFLFEIDKKTAKRKPVLKGRITQISNVVESPFRVKVRREFQYLATGAETLNSPESLKKFVPKNATIEQKSRKITTKISTECDNERPTTVTTVLEEKGNREKRQVKNQVYREAFLAESLDKTKNIEENSQEIQNYNLGHEKDHFEIPDNQEPEIQKLTSKDELPSTPAQGNIGNIQNAQDNVVIHNDRNKPQTVHDQPLISDIKQNEPSSIVHSTQKYNEIKDQAGKIKARHDHDEPNADDQVQSTVHENLSKKAKMDAKDSNGSETTEQKIYKELRPAKNTKVTHVESVSRDDLKTGNQRDLTHQPNALDQGEVISISKETSPCESHQNRKHESDLEIENKDIQPKEKKRSNQIYPGIEAMNVQNEPSGSVLDQDLGGEDEKPVKSCWPRRKKKNEKETKKKEKEEKKEKKEKKKGENQAKKNAKKEKKKRKKEAKENEKKEKREKKEEKKKEKEEKKKLKKQAKTN